ncbi:hypothetical protein C8J55DRAFT_559758 [Lentinula edodes]|uniref:Uncharacterized protein n=1 Tax=Lentinula lateritia TaxID=40482 RepID=A0A9W9AJ70_9AGAR|nr:hypothetical protein C8J55DRAFT_559758 [Lentinula edodes]
MPRGDHEQLPETSQTHLANLHPETDSSTSLHFLLKEFKPSTSSSLTLAFPTPPPSTQPSLDPNPSLYPHLRSYPEHCLQHPYPLGSENASSATLFNRDEFPVVDDLNQLHREPYNSNLWHHSYRNRQTPVFIRTEPRAQRVMSGYIDPLPLSRNPAKRSLDHIHQCTVSG